MNEIDFQKQLCLSSVPLVRLNDQRLPTGYGSGCLIDYCGKRVLLTVSHVTGDQRNWAIQLRYVPNKGTETYQLGAMHFLRKGSWLTPTVDDIDFAYAEVPSSVRVWRQEIEVRANVAVVKSQTTVTIHSASLEDLPEPADNFGFCGITKPTFENHRGRICIGGELPVYSGLSFLRTVSDYHVFRLPFAHPGHEHFRGCSGAPILSSSGSLVALVCGGDEETDEIWGLSLKVFRIAIDILVGNVT